MTVGEVVAPNGLGGYRPVNMGDIRELVADSASIADETPIIVTNIKEIRNQPDAWHIQKLKVEQVINGTG